MHEYRYFLDHLGNTTSALFFACLAYFAPISGVIHVMVGTIILDQIFGLAAARKRGEAIKSSKLWRTGEKLFYSVVIVASLFAIDQEMNVVESHRFVAFLVAGWEMWSILESAAFLTNHPMFRMIQKFMIQKTEEATGIDISEREDNSGK